MYSIFKYPLPKKERMFKAIANYCEYQKEIHEYAVGPFNRWFPLKYLILSPMMVPGVATILVYDTLKGVFYTMPRYIVKKTKAKPVIIMNA